MKKGKKLKKKAARSARRTKTNSRIKALQRRRKKCEEGVTRRGGTRWPHLNHHCTRMASFIRKFKICGMRCGGKSCSTRYTIEMMDDSGAACLMAPTKRKVLTHASYLTDITMAGYKYRSRVSC
ncbi:uncharacterized protein LOC117207888 isoform X2 [Bombus bifarius]|uniref:Uncharacterized protein LOC117207888 isoform X2 n=1 Tax=Bombus bifarius TaxID=103933 RepID=A0A6P8LU24_9HYME|nr:uncharacterized protein LOC117207888 isoform X2 [Bombus bifarius]